MLGPSLSRRLNRAPPMTGMATVCFVVIVHIVVTVRFVMVVDRLLPEIFVARSRLFNYNASVRLTVERSAGHCRCRRLIRSGSVALVLVIVMSRMRAGTLSAVTVITGIVIMVVGMLMPVRMFMMMVVALSVVMLVIMTLVATMIMVMLMIMAMVVVVVVVVVVAVIVRVFMAIVMIVTIMIVVVTVFMPVLVTVSYLLGC